MFVFRTITLILLLLVAKYVTLYVWSAALLIQMGALLVFLIPTCQVVLRLPVSAILTTFRIQR